MLGDYVATHDRPCLLRMSLERIYERWERKVKAKARVQREVVELRGLVGTIDLGQTEPGAARRGTGSRRSK